MPLIHLDKAPFPYHGGKRKTAPAVWAALGDVAHYVEPFMGSLAVLLLRPHQANRPYYSETVNDADGLLCNAFRSIQLSPEETAVAASWPVCEADMHARHLALVRWRESTPLERLMGDPTYHDPVMGGFWIWGCSCWIGGGWCAGDGPWTVDADGIFWQQPRAPKGTREPGVDRQILFLGNDGRGINTAATREPGVRRKIPHVTDNGQGINHAGAREPGVDRKIPYLGDNGRGINHAGAREPGVGDFHPMTMPEVERWIAFLSARLRHVRILNGDWKRSCTNGVMKTLPVRGAKGFAGVFLDPPYSGAERTKNLYAVDSGDVAEEVRAWCIKHGPDPKLRIVLAGFDGEHNELVDNHGWRVVEWFKKGHLTGGMRNVGKKGTQAGRERLWLSPACLEEQCEP